MIILTFYSTTCYWWRCNSSVASKKEALEDKHELILPFDWATCMIKFHHIWLVSSSCLDCEHQHLVTLQCPLPLAMLCIVPNMGDQDKHGQSWGWLWTHLINLFPCTFTWKKWSLQQPINLKGFRILDFFPRKWSLWVPPSWYRLYDSVFLVSLCSHFSFV